MAQQSGVRFDVGHGDGGFHFGVARRAIEQGFIPDTVSSDISLHTALDPRFHVPTVMSKLMAVGVNLEQAVAMATSLASGDPRTARVYRHSGSRCRC